MFPPLPSCDSLWKYIRMCSRVLTRLTRKVLRHVTLFGSTSGCVHLYSLGWQGKVPSSDSLWKYFRMCTPVLTHLTRKGAPSVTAFESTSGCVHLYSLCWQGKGSVLWQPLEVHRDVFTCTHSFNKERAPSYDSLWKHIRMCSLELTRLTRKGVRPVTAFGSTSGGVHPYSLCWRGKGSALWQPLEVHQDVFTCTRSVDKERGPSCDSLGK